MEVSEKFKDKRDAEIARHRLEEISKDLSLLIEGEALRERLAELEKAERSKKP